jgi:Flp pilus assembly CpaF family ATPase
MSYELILPFFPEELRELLLDPSISDLMINGTTGVFADRNGKYDSSSRIRTSGYKRPLSA